MRFYMPLTKSTHVSTGWVGASFYSVVWLMLASVWVTLQALRLIVLGIVALVRLVRS